MRLSIILVIFLITGCFQQGMRVSSSFSNGDLIPVKYSCKGDNINPPINVSDLPNGVKSLALIIDDPDAPNGDWVHWVMWNIPLTGVKEGSAPGVQGVNSWGRNEYGGPCPPSGTHHYHFKIYALDTELDLPNSINKYDLEKAMNDHVLAKAELIGLFSK